MLEPSKRKAKDAGFIAHRFSPVIFSAVRSTFQFIFVAQVCKKEFTSAADELEEINPSKNKNMITKMNDRMEMNWK